MLEALASAAKLRWVQVTVAIVVGVAVLGPRFLDSGDGDDGAATTTTTETTEVAPTTTSTTVATGPTFEVDRTGDQGNPGALYPGRPDIRPDDQERGIGGDPARISGFSAWVTSVELPDTRPNGDDQERGPWVRALVRVVNRDDVPQPATFDDWRLVAPDGVTAPPTYASLSLSEGRDLPANGEAVAELWFPRRASGQAWLLYRPQHDEARGVWALTLP